MSLSQHRQVFIFRDRLLPTSETFVRAQASALRGFDITYVGCRRIPGGLALPEGRVLIAGSQFPGEVIGRFAFELWGIAPSFYKAARMLDPVLVHAHFGTDGALALPIARTLRIPLVVTFHGFDATIRDNAVPRSHLAHQIYLRRRRTLQREGSLFIAVSEFVKERLLEQGYDRDKTVVHYIGIDTDYFQPTPGVTREPVVLFVGRLVEKKGCEHLLRAMIEVQRAVPDTRVVIIGEGPLRERLERDASEGVRHCTFLGSQPPDVVREWMNRAQVFCTPSVTAESGDAEGFGLVFAEAQSMGLPVVSFRSGGVSEAVADGETGFLVPEKDSRALAGKIIELFRTPELWTRFSSAGQVRVRSLFDLRTQTAQLERTYDALLTRRAQEQAVTSR